MIFGNRARPLFPVLAGLRIICGSGGADRAGLLSGDMTRGERFGLLGATGGAGPWVFQVSRARAINRHELRGNEAGQAAPPALRPRRPLTIMVLRGANSVTSAVPIGSTPPMPIAGKSTNDPKPGKKAPRLPRRAPRIRNRPHSAAQPRHQTLGNLSKIRDLTEIQNP